MKEKIREIISRITLYRKNKVKVKGKNNVFNFNRAKLSGCNIHIVGDNNTIELQLNTMIQNTLIYINGSNNRIFLGEHCRYCGGALYIEDNNSAIIVGDFASVEEAAITSTEDNNSIEIGKNCLFSYGIEIRNGDSHSIVSLENNKRINYGEKVKLGDHIWIGSHSTILKGVTIASNTTIATRTVVTKSILEEYTINAGVPATKIKDNVNWASERL